MLQTKRGGPTHLVDRRIRPLSQFLQLDVIPSRSPRHSVIPGEDRGGFDKVTVGQAGR